MAESTRCIGKDSNGEPCICMRCTDTEVVDNRTLCLNCGHIESAHPQPRLPVGSLIRQYRDAGRLAPSSTKGNSSSTRKATQVEAEAETSTGLKKKRKSDTDTEPVIKRKKKGALVEEKVKGEEVEVGHIVVLVDGIKGKPARLTNPKPPKPLKIDEMIKHKIAIMSTPERRLSINTAWSTNQCSTYFQSLFPQLFSYLACHLPKADPTVSEDSRNQLWLAVIKEHQSVGLSQEDFPTGASLCSHVKRKGHKGSERILYIASKIHISEERWTDWDVESDSEPEEEPVDFDMLDEDETPRKPSAKSRGKAPARHTPAKEVVVKVEKREAALDLPDMKKAAKMRTRLATETIKRKTIHIPNSSDDERLETIEVSDDEPDLPHPSTLSMFLQPSPAAPLFTSIDRSPSPVSATFDEFDFNSIPPSPTENLSAHSSGWASTSSLVSSSSVPESSPSLFGTAGIASSLTSNFGAPTQPTTSWAGSSSMPSSSGISSASTNWTNSTSVASTISSTSAAAPRVVQSSGIFTRGGKRKSLVNPWKRDA
ncbi:hypothetical protein B0H12DRAFT_1069853 [Mycena haematopus]|nr:hypothetical protein B0H12DRAFT_1069853 [Mycena haematopus]